MVAAFDKFAVRILHYQISLCPTAIISLSSGLTIWRFGSKWSSKDFRDFIYPRFLLSNCFPLLYHLYTFSDTLAFFLFFTLQFCSDIMFLPYILCAIFGFHVSKSDFLLKGLRFFVTQNFRILQRKRKFTMFP